MTQPNPISQQEFAETFEAMHEGIAIFNAVDEITYFNRSFAVLHKVSRKTLPGASLLYVRRKGKSEEPTLTFFRHYIT